MERSSRVTIRHIAERLGISHSTVSRALRDSTLVLPSVRERVQATASELGYIADSTARTMRGQPSTLIGLMLPDVRADFFSALTTSFGKACSDRGYNLILSVSQHDATIEETQIRALRGARVAGILIYPTADLSLQSVRMLADVRTVQVGRRHPLLPAPFVASDDRASMATLVRRLVALGHQHFGYIGPDPRFSPGQQRLESFREALGDAGFSINEELLITGEATARTGAAAAERLLKHSPRPTAIVVASAPFAEGVLDVVQKHRLQVPEDLSITSFGDPYWYRTWGPGISTVAMPIDEIVVAALPMLLDGEASQDSVIWSNSRNVLLPSQVIERGTMGPVK